MPPLLSQASTRVGTVSIICTIAYAGISSASLTNTSTKLRVEIDPHQIAAMHLVGSDQIRKRMHQRPFDRALQMPRAILHVRAFAQQELARFGGHD